MKLVCCNMKATFQYRQKVVQEPATASTVLDLFPRFLDTPGLVRSTELLKFSVVYYSGSLFVCSLMCFFFFFSMLRCVLKIDQDFTMLFGDEVSVFDAKWPTFFKPRIIADCQKLSQSAQVDELLLSAQSDDDSGKFTCFLGIHCIAHISCDRSGLYQCCKSPLLLTISQITQFLYSLFISYITGIWFPFISVT